MSASSNTVSPVRAVAGDQRFARKLCAVLNTGPRPGAALVRVGGRDPFEIAPGTPGDAAAAAKSREVQDWFDQSIGRVSPETVLVSRECNIGNHNRDVAQAVHSFRRRGAKFPTED